MKHRALLVLGMVASLAACGSDPPVAPTDGGGGGGRDSGPRADAGPPFDAGPLYDGGPRVDAGGGGGTDAGPMMLIPPGDPGPGDVRFDISSGRARHAISPYIYGDNQADLDGDVHGVTATRLGGNRWTAYNWETNASNAGSDYMYQNDTYLGGGTEPGGAVRGTVARAHTGGLATLVTVPIAGYVSADTSGPTDPGGGDIATRFFPSMPMSPGAFGAMPNLTDRVVYQDEFVDWGRRTLMPTGTVFWSLDNEPDLWSSTHSEIHPMPVRYAELVTRNVEYASAIKRVVPDALVFGPVNYGWAGYQTLQSAPDAMGRDFLEFWLDAMRAAETTAGHRLVDVLDLHWYSEATGGGARITDEGTGAAEVAARVQAPRSLWDASYVESSWITDCCGLGPIRLIPRLREMIAAHYPGTRLAFTEYNYGGSGDISGGIAQADVLGIYGREDVFAAMWWQLASERQFVDAAFEMFRDFDGTGGTFGDTSIEAMSPDAAATSIYASVDGASADRVVLVAINKTMSPLHAAIAVEHTRILGSARVFRLTSGAPRPVPEATITLTATNAFGIDLPARSVTTIEMIP